MSTRSFRRSGAAALTLTTAALALGSLTACEPPPCPVGGYTFKVNTKDFTGTKCADHIVAGPDVETIHAGGGNDIVEVQANPAKKIGIDVWLGAGNDKLTSARTRGYSGYNGEAGNDSIETSSTPDQDLDAQWLEGGPGDDRLVPSGLAYVNGDDGNDHIILKPGPKGASWASGPTQVYGDDGNDLIDSRKVLPDEKTLVQGEDLEADEFMWPEMHGGLGDDTFLTNQGNGTNAEHLFGEKGFDTAVTDPQDVTLSLEEHTIVP